MLGNRVLLGRDLYPKETHAKESGEEEQRQREGRGDKEASASAQVTLP